MESIRVQSTSYSITLHFTLPPQLQYIGTLRGFRVVIHEVNSKLKYTSTTVLLPSSSPTKPKLTIDRLHPDARHSFNISLVLNGGATGNLAPLVYGTTLEAGKHSDPMCCCGECCQVLPWQYILILSSWISAHFQWLSNKFNFCCIILDSAPYH